MRLAGSNFINLTDVINHKEEHLRRKSKGSGEIDGAGTGFSP
jgi:hypothetical protein